MRALRQAVIALVALALVVVAIANRGAVQIRLLPDDLALVAGWNVAADVPVFAVFFAGIVAGVVIGFVWEWLREHKHRVAARAARAAAPAPQAGTDHRQDDILALIDGPGKG
jgi:putative membrane protein